MAKSAERRTLQLRAPVEGWENIDAATDGGGDRPALRRFNMVAYTGGPMMLAAWPHPVVVDLSGLQVSARSRPILKDHNPSLIVGHTDSVSVQGSSLTVAGVISGAGAVAREIVESSRNGFPWQASLGAVAERVEFVPKGRKAQANGREFEGPVHIARKSVLGEISFVALGADDNTTATVAASQTGAVKEDDMEFTAWLEARGFDAESLSDAQRASLQAMYDAEQKAGPAAPDGGNPDPVAELRAQLAAETKRVAEIRRICAVGGGKHHDLEAKAIGEGWDITRTELEVLRARIHDLRRLGYRITTRIAGGTATYTLEGATNGN